jgi:hypothetical protein
MKSVTPATRKDHTIEPHPMLLPYRSPLLQQAMQRARFRGVAQIQQLRRTRSIRDIKPPVIAPNGKPL